MTDGTIAAGFFDGVHPGHRRILEGADRVVTFLNHPASVLAPERAPRLLMEPGEKIAAIRALGVRDVVALEFTPALAAMTPAGFAAKHLRGAKVRCGANWRFGKGAKGDAEFLRSAGIEVEVVPYAECAEGRVSSTKIRDALEKGEIEKANRMLGREWSATGKTERGKGLGARIGFPTVNLSLPEGLVRLPRGVYSVRALGMRGVANWGLAPTFGEGAWKRETLEINFERAPSGPVPAKMRVSFERFVRPEMKFGSVEELARRIAADRLDVFSGAQ